MEAAGIEPEVSSTGSSDPITAYAKCHSVGAARALHVVGSSCRCMTLDARLRAIVEAWEHLPESTRAEVEALCLEPASRNIPRP